MMKINPSQTIFKKDIFGKTRNRATFSYKLLLRNIILINRLNVYQLMRTSRQLMLLLQKSISNYKNEIITVTATFCDSLCFHLRQLMVQATKAISHSKSEFLRAPNETG